MLNDSEMTAQGEKILCIRRDLVSTYKLEAAKGNSGNDPSSHRPINPSALLDLGSEVGLYRAEENMPARDL